MPPSCPFTGGSDAGEGTQSSTSEEKSQRNSHYKATTSEDCTSKSYSEKAYRSPEYNVHKLQCRSSEGGGEEVSSTTQSNWKDLLSSCAESSIEAGEGESSVEAGERCIWRGENKEEEEEEENEGCCTPRATECRIPQLHFCPPAPRKRKPCLRLPFTRQFSGLLVVPDFDAFFPLPKISVRD